MHARTTPAQPNPQDLLERAFEFCGAAASRAAAAAVGRATDALQLLVPQSTPRPKVEAAVKGALALLALALVKSVLSVSATSSRAGWGTGLFAGIAPAAASASGARPRSRLGLAAGRGCGMPPAGVMVEASHAHSWFAERCA